jgi:membrane-bound inhibitor of C-type lysozyme
MRLALPALALLTACGSKSAPEAPPAGVIPPPSAPQGVAAAVYTCTDSTEVFALFANDSSGTSVVSLAIGEARLRLRQVQSASGARYSDSTNTFWNKGGEVTLEWNGVTRTCTEAPTTTPTGAATPNDGAAPTRPSAVHGTP